MVIQCMEFRCRAQTKSCSSSQTGLLTHSGSGASYTLTSEGRYEGETLKSIFNFDFLLVHFDNLWTNG